MKDDKTEAAKLTANFLNGIALAIVVGTLVGPGMLWLAGQSPLVAAGAGLCLSAGLHLAARLAIRQDKER